MIAAADSAQFADGVPDSYNAAKYWFDTQSTDVDVSRKYYFDVTPAASAIKSAIKDYGTAGVGINDQTLGIRSSNIYAITDAHLYAPSSAEWEQNSTVYKQIMANILNDFYELNSNAQFFTTQTTQIWTAPYSGTYVIDVAGSKGNDFSGKTGGAGGKVTLTVYLEKGQQLYLRPNSVSGGVSNNASYGAAGGAGSYIQVYNGTQWVDLVYAGGGGGANKFNNGSNGGAEGTQINGTAGKTGTSGGGGGAVGGAGGQAVEHTHSPGGGSLVAGTALTANAQYSSPGGCYTKAVTVHHDGLCPGYIRVTSAGDNWDGSAILVSGYCTVCGFVYNDYSFPKYYGNNNVRYQVKDGYFCDCEAEGGARVTCGVARCDHGGWNTTAYALNCTSPAIVSSSPAGGGTSFVTSNKGFGNFEVVDKAYYAGNNNGAGYVKITYNEFSVGVPSTTNNNGDATTRYLMWSRSFAGLDAAASYFGAYDIENNGSLGIDTPIASSLAVAPAFNLNMAKVVSARNTIPGNEVSASPVLVAYDPSSLRGTDSSSPTGVKFMLVDTGLSISSDINGKDLGNIVPGETYEIPYSGLSTTLVDGSKSGSGAKLFIAAAIYDENNNLCYSGEIGEISFYNNLSSTGTVSVTIPAELGEGTYKLAIYEEQISGTNSGKSGYNKTYGQGGYSSAIDLRQTVYCMLFWLMPL